MIKQLLTYSILLLSIIAIDQSSKTPLMAQSWPTHACIITVSSPDNILYECKNTGTVFRNAMSCMDLAKESVE
jgi:hypothetical protein